MKDVIHKHSWRFWLVAVVVGWLTMIAIGHFAPYLPHRLSPSFHSSR